MHAIALCSFKINLVIWEPFHEEIYDKTHRKISVGFQNVDSETVVRNRIIVNVSG